MSKPWNYHDGSSLCPVHPSTPIMVYYSDGDEEGDEGDLLAAQPPWELVVAYKEWEGEESYA
jgi:hypothetical protein